MSYDFVVVGATGLQGRIVSRDLLEKGYRVLLCGRHKKKLVPLLKRFKHATFKYVELEDNSLTANVLKRAKAPIVVNCAEGDFNLAVQKICLKIGCHYLDLGSSPKMTADQFALHSAFQKKGLCAITGCGSVPGIGNVMLRYAAAKLDKVDTIQAGFAWTANKEVFVVPFSIISIIEEFTDTPTLLENGKFRKVPAQSDAQIMRFREIGKQKVFLVRHAEAVTFFRYLKSKGIRNIKFYAGFPKFSYDIIMDFIKAGLGSKKPLNGTRPIDLLAYALESNAAPAGYREKENLWVTLSGKRGGKKKIISMTCLVPTLKGWEQHGCNIDTGLPCSIMAQMLKDKVITATGSRSPEFFVPVKPFFKELSKRKMRVYENGRRVN